MEYCCCDYRDNPNPIDSVIYISKITRRLQSLTLMFHDELFRKLLKRTEMLQPVPSAVHFGMYLENYLMYGESPGSRLVLTEFLSFRELSPEEHSKAALLIADIHECLKRMAQSYIESHFYDRIKVYRLLKQIINISKQLVIAAYATPTLSGGIFGDSVSKLEHFIWELARKEKTSDQVWSIPRWAALRDECDISIDEDRTSVFNLAVLNVGEVLAGYAGTPGSHFSSMPPDIAEQLSIALSQLQKSLDPFEDARAWRVISLLQNKSADYYLPEGRL